MKEMDYEELVKATESFSQSRLIGKGSHGSVYKGVLEDDKVVAVKKLSPNINGIEDDNSKKLDNEILVLSSLPEKCPFIINSLGTSHDSVKKNKLLVMEFMPNGSLYDFLHVSPSPPPWPKRVEIATQIARAVQFLHESRPLIIHRDIKSANILFDSNWNANLADFGLAVSRVDSSDSVSQPAGTIGYLDPCYTIPSKLSTKIDIYSFGVVLLEIISCRKVIDVMATPASIIEWAIPLVEEEREREICDGRIVLPKYMEATIRQMLRMASRCVSLIEKSRPTIGEVVMGMENCFLERIRIPVWMSLLPNVIWIRRKRKLAKRCRENCVAKESGGDIVQCDISRGKQILLRDILAADHI